MQTEVFRIDPERFDPLELEPAAQILRTGGLVSFPTETVYGIGANAHLPEAVHALRRIKNRSEDKPLTLHIADREEVARLVDEIPPLAATLMDLYWPGPLTIVFPSPGDGGIGIRLPSHPVAREFIRRCNVPVLAPSANRGGEPPAVKADEVLRVFDGEIHAVIDGGPVAIRQASTVLRLVDEGREFEILREGLITEEMIRKTLRGKYIVFVCTGNSCRSPMAEAIFKQLLAEKLSVLPDKLPEMGFRIASAGISAFGGGSASAHAIALMAERGLDLSGHRSHPLTQQMAADADLIITLSASHRWHLESWDPRLAAKVEVINEAGVVDPIGGSLETYRECAAEIESALREKWLQRVLEL